MLNGLEQRLHKIASIKGLEVIDSLADADEFNANLQLSLEGDDNATLRGSIEFC